MSDQRRSAAVQRAMEDRHGLNDSLLVQYGRAMAQLAHGDLGISMKKDVSVNALIAQHGPVSAILGLLGLTAALAIGVMLGVIAAWKRNTWVDYALMSVALIGISLPSFVLGPLLIAAFSIKLGWLAPARVDHASSFVLPAITLGLIYLATIARLARGGMVDALQQDFIRTARAKAKGLPERVVVWKHALRVGIVPVVTATSVRRRRR